MMMMRIRNAKPRMANLAPVVRALNCCMACEQGAKRHAADEEPLGHLWGTSACLSAATHTWRSMAADAHWRFIHLCEAPRGLRAMRRSGTSMKVANVATNALVAKMASHTPAEKGLRKAKMSSAAGA